MSQVLGLTPEETVQTAVRAARQIRDLADTMTGADIRFQFSPEEFTDTDPAFALEVCEAVFSEWGRATREKPLILNLPATVERRLPNEYADMIEWFCRRFPHRDRVTISVHAHNDQGMAVAATELAVAAVQRYGRHGRVRSALFDRADRRRQLGCCHTGSRRAGTGRARSGRGYAGNGPDS